MVDRRQFLGATLSALALTATPALARVKPVLLIFPTGRDSMAPVGDTSKDGPSEATRMVQAARAVRAQFEEEGGVEAILFDPEAPAIVRALAEAKVKLGNADLTEEQRLRIGAAFGAHYVLTVTSKGGGELLRLDQQISQANRATEKAYQDIAKAAERGGKKNNRKTTTTTVVEASAGPTMTLDAVEVKRGAAGRRWHDTVTLSLDAGTVADLAAQKQAFSTAMTNAARSLVIRFLNGPLRDVRLATAEKTILPPPLPPPPTVSVAEAEGAPVDPDAEAADLIRRADILRTEGKPDAGIVTLRRAVSLAPRSLTPRMTLIHAYLDIQQPSEAIGEARRALAVVPNIPEDRRKELTRLMARALSDDKDPAAARAIYEQALKDDPNNSEFQLAYADLLLAQGEVGAAEVKYRILRKREPGNVDAARGLGRILAARGDYDAALRESAASESPQARYALATVVFIEGANDLAARVAQNRTAWEEGKLNREALYKAATAQASRATQLLALLTSSAPPEGIAEIERQAHKRRVLAASLLSQSVTSLVGFLENGEPAAGVKARTLLNEFFFEMKQSQDPPRTAIPARPVR